MRLAMSFFILVVTALDFRYGEPGSALQLAAMVAGALLALSVIVDHLFPMTMSPPVTARDRASPHAEPTQTAP
jgi:hypothetical protein